MTDHDDAGPEVLTRARRTSPTTNGLASAADVRRRSDRRRRRQWAGGAAVAAVLAGSVALVPWAGVAGDGDLTIAVDREGDRAGDGDRAGVVTADGLTFSLPDGWAVLDRSAPRRTCVGPAGADGCPVEIVVAEDPTEGDDPLGPLTEELDDGCRRTLAQVLRILSKSQGDPPASTYRGQCAGGGQDPTTTDASTVVALDSGTASATTRDPDLTRQARRIVASFEVPEGWAQESRVFFHEADPAPR